MVEERWNFVDGMGKKVWGGRKDEIIIADWWWINGNDRVELDQNNSRSEKSMKYLGLEWLWCEMRDEFEQFKSRVKWKGLLSRILMISSDTIVIAGRIIKDSELIINLKRCFWLTWLLLMMKISMLGEVFGFGKKQKDNICEQIVGNNTKFKQQ